MSSQSPGTEPARAPSGPAASAGAEHGSAHADSDVDDDRRVRLLRERARLMAAPASTDRDDRPSTEFVMFHLASELYGIELTSVVELSPLRDLMPLPCVPPFLSGLISVHGRVIPVLDLKYFFELPIDGLIDLHTAVVISGSGIEIGLLTDTVLGIERIADNEIMPAVATLSDVRAEYCRGHTAGGAVLLNPERILSDPRIVIDEKPIF